MFSSTRKTLAATLTERVQRARQELKDVVEQATNGILARQGQIDDLKLEINELVDVRFGATN
jgi:hypothetical protein